MANPTGANQVLTKVFDEPNDALRVNAVAGGESSSGAWTRPTITNTSTTILAANAARKYAVVVNNNGFTAYLKLGSAAVVNEGIPLAPNARFEIKRDNLWTGDIRAIKATATAVALDVFEGTT